MKTILSLIAITACLAGSSAYAEKEAGGREGHGGRIWNCNEQDGSTSMELVDLYRGRTRWNLTPDFGTGTTVREILDYRLAVLAKVNPGMASTLKFEIDKFDSRSYQLEDMRFFDLHDLASEIGERINCKQNVVINQGYDIPRFSTEKEAMSKVRFWINQHVWKKLTPQLQAALIMHEVIYEQAINVGHKRVDETMYVVANLFSSKLGELSSKQFKAILDEAKYPVLYYGFALDYEKYYPNTLKIESGRLIHHTNSNGLNFKEHSYIKFYENEKIKSADLDYSSLTLKGVTYQIFGNTLFDENGVIRATDLARNADGVYDKEYMTPSGFTLMPGKGYSTYIDRTYKPITSVQFHPDGTLAMMTPHAQKKLNINGQDIVLSGNTSWYENGNLKSIGFLNTYDAQIRGKTFKFKGSIRFKELDPKTVSMGILGKKVKVIDIAGKKRKIKSAEVYRESEINEVASSIYSKNLNDDYFIKFVPAKNEKKTGLRLCKVEQPESCRIIGNREFYADNVIREFIRIDSVTAGRGQAILVDSAILVGVGGLAAAGTIASFGSPIIILAIIGDVFWGVVSGTFVADAGFDKPDENLFPLTAQTEKIAIKRLLKRDDQVCEYKAGWMTIQQLSVAIGNKLNQVNP